MVQVAAQTQAVLKSTGGSANVTAGDVDVLATSLSRLSGVDDEAIASAENLILTFKNVRNEVGEGNAIFDRATLAALDLSKAAGGAFGDLPTTAKQLAKALNDPVKGMTALGRAGVTFTASRRRRSRGWWSRARCSKRRRSSCVRSSLRWEDRRRRSGRRCRGSWRSCGKGSEIPFGTLVATAIVPLKRCCR